MKINTITGKLIAKVAFATLLLLFPVSGVFSTANQTRDSLILRYESTEDQAAQYDIAKKISRLSFKNGDYLAAIDFFEKESEFSLLFNDSLAWANTQYNLGMVYSILRDFDKATYHSSQALIFFEHRNYLREVGNTSINLGHISNELRQTETAVAYYKKAEEIFEALIKQPELDASYINLGILSDKGQDAGNLRNQKENTDDFNRQSIQLAITAIKTSLGKIYSMNGNLEEAFRYLNDALQMAELNNEKTYQAITLVALGSLNLDKGKVKEAVQFLNEGLLMASEMKLGDVMLDALAELASASMKSGKSALAYEYLNEYIAIKDSIHNELLNNRLQQDSYSQGVGIQELRAERLLRQNLEQALAIEKSNNSRLALLGIGLLVFVLLVFIFRRYYTRNKTYDHLEEKTKLIEQQKIELENLIVTKDRFLSIIAHDLKNPFTSLLGFADLAYNEFDEISEAEKRSYLNIIRLSSQQIYSLLDNLLTWSRAQSGRIDFKPEKVSLSDLVENSLDVVRSSAENKQITLFKDFSRDVYVNADKNMIFTVLRNLLTNAVKFTPNGGSVTVSCHCDEKTAEVIVSDTGIGMNEDELSRIFRLDGNLKNSGTNNETGTGLGLILCQEFMHLHKSKILVESTPGKGSKFSLRLDIIKS